MAADSTNTIMAVASPEDRLRELDRALDGPERHATILAGLNDQTTLVREHAIALAARYLQPEVLGRLIREEANAVLRNSALSSLERQGPYAVEHLIALAHDPDTEVAMFAVQVLSRISDPSTAGALIPLLEHADTNVAQAAIEALGGIRAREAVPSLLRLLDSDPWLQFAAVAALGQIGDDRAVQALLAHIDDELLAEGIADALGQIGSPEAAMPLLTLLCSGDRLPMRDRLLLALASILERRTVPASIAGRLRGRIASPQARELTDYLRSVLELDDSALARAAVVMALVGRIASLLPTVFIRACDRAEDAPWIVALCDRFRAVLKPHVNMLLSHEDVRVRKGALMAAPLDHAAQSVALAFLDDESARVRAAACIALGRAPTTDAVPKLVDRLLQGGPEEAAAAAEALGRCPGSWLRPLERGLKDGVASEVLISCLGVLAAARSALFRDRVEELLFSPAPDVRRAALRVAAHYPARMFVAIAARCTEADDPVLRLDAIEHLSRRRSAGSAPLLTSLLERHVELRYHLIRALGRLRFAPVVPRLIELFPQCARHEQIEIAAALVQIGTPEACAFLERHLDEPDQDVRRIAADGVARLAMPDHASVLMKLAGDTDWVVRNHAAWGLGRLAVAETRPSLLTLVRDVAPVVARAARAALAKLEHRPEQSGTS